MARGKISLLLGAAVGALFGILFAPTKGKELRDKIKSERASGGTGLNTIKSSAKKMHQDIAGEFNKLKKNKKINEFANQAKEKFSDLTGIDENEISDFSAVAGEKLGSLKAKAKELTDKAKKQVQDKVSAVKKKVDEGKRKAKEISNKTQLVVKKLKK